MVQELWMLWGRIMDIFGQELRMSWARNMDVVGLRIMKRHVPYVIMHDVNFVQQYHCLE
jgi:hypothetical protein